MRHRPIGIGVQGLADALVKLRLPYEGDAARQLNKDIFETIYYGAVRRPIHFTMTTRLVSRNDGRGCFFCRFRGRSDRVETPSRPKRPEIEKETTHGLA